MRLIRVAVCTFALLLTAEAPARVALRCGPHQFILEWNGEDPTLITNWKITNASGPVGDWPMTHKDGTIYIGEWPCKPVTTLCPERQC
jgi:hypothetical protein